MDKIIEELNSIAKQMNELAEFVEIHRYDDQE
jgi:hypothetical protein